MKNIVLSLHLLILIKPVKESNEYGYEDYEEIMLDLFESKCDLEVTLRRLKVFNDLKNQKTIESLEGDADHICTNYKLI